MMIQMELDDCGSYASSSRHCLDCTCLYVGYVHKRFLSLSRHGWRRHLFLALVRCLQVTSLRNVLTSATSGREQVIRYGSLVLGKRVFRPLCIRVSFVNLAFKFWVWTFVAQFIHNPIHNFTANHPPYL